MPGIWALGECTGKGGFSNTAYNDFEIVAANLLDGSSRQAATAYPLRLYIDPPLRQSRHDRGRGPAQQR